MKISPLFLVLVLSASAFGITSSSSASGLTLDNSDVATGSTPRSVTVADLNAHEKFDLVAANSSSAMVSVTENITGTAVQPVTLSFAILPFGNQTVGTTSAAKAVTLTNNQSTALSISGISTSGDYAQTNTCGTSLAASANCTISVTFTPTAAGTRSGALTVVDDASNSPQTASLSGTGIQPVTLSVTILPFGNQPVGTTSAAKAVMLTNNQSIALSISGISVSGDYAQTNTCGTSLAASAKCTIRVTFTPTATKTRNGTLTVVDDASNSPQTATLTGAGVQPVTLSFANLPFGNQAVGTTSAAKAVTLTNNQNTALSISGISASGDYAQTNTCGSSLAGLANCAISVTFAPMAAGTRNGALTVIDDASNSPQTASLTGIGTGMGNSAVTLSVPTLSFGNQTVGTTSAAQAVTLTNNQSTALSISGISASGDYAQTNTCGTSLAASANCTISVTFAPTAAGTRNGALTVIDDASNSPQTASLTGTGIQPVSCPSKGWCRTWAGPSMNSNSPVDFGWNTGAYSPDTGLVYLFAVGNGDSQSPFANAWLTYSYQAQPSPTNPWKVLSTCGNNATNNPNKDFKTLTASIAAADTTLSVNVTGGLQNPLFTPTGTLTVGDEDIDYASVSGNVAGSTSVTFSGLTRGTRQDAGNSPAAQHSIGTLSYVACPKPQQNLGNGLVPIADHPMVRHPEHEIGYDLLNHVLWQTGGHHTTYNLPDTWQLCVAMSPLCPNGPGPWQRVLTTTNVPGRKNGQAGFDSTAGAFIVFAGLADDSYHPTTWVMCAAPNPSAGCATANSWYQVTNQVGPVPAWRQGAVLQYMPDSQDMLIFGGYGLGGTSGSNNPLNDTAIYNTNTRTWITHTDTGAIPPVGTSTNTPTAWPAFTYDTHRNFGVLWAGPGQLYTYDPSTFTWTLLNVPGGPVLDPNLQYPSRNLFYDSVDDVFIFVQQGVPPLPSNTLETWQLPGSVISALP